MYCGKQPAITAFIAIFSTVAGAQRGGTTPITSCGFRLTAAIISPTRSSVGGMIGKPSVQPFSSKKALTAQRSSPTSTRSDCSALELITVSVQSSMFSSKVSGVGCQVSVESQVRGGNLTPVTRNLTPVLHLVFRWLDQELHQLIESSVCAFVHFFHLHRTDRMLNDQHRMIRRAERFFLRLGQGIEGVGN